MKRNVRVAAGLTALVGMLGATVEWSRAGAEGDDGGAEPELQRADPIIVVVRAYADAGGSAAGATPASSGLGFVVESDGIILTTYGLLVDPADGVLHPAIEVGLPGVEGGVGIHAATVVGLEPTLNLGILRIEAGRELTAARICARDRIVPEVRIRAAREVEDGLPRFNEGVITDLNSMECYQETITATMLQGRIELPDSAVGGPVINDDDEVVAVFTGYIPRADDEHDEPALEPGKVHLLPIFLVFNIYESIKLKKSLKSPWTGFSVRPLTAEEQARFPVGRFLGAVGIDFVWEGGPAERLGIREGDLLVGFSYYPIRSVGDFQKWLYLYGVDSDVKLHVLHEGREHRAHTYRVEERPTWAKPR